MLYGKKVTLTENPHKVLQGRFLINQCFVPLNETRFITNTYYSFLNFNAYKPGGEINRKNNLKLIKFTRNIQKIFSLQELGLKKL